MSGNSSIRATLELLAQPTATATAPARAAGEAAGSAAAAGLDEMTSRVWSRVAPNLVGVYQGQEALPRGPLGIGLARPALSLAVAIALAITILHAWPAPTARGPAAYFPPNAPLAELKPPLSAGGAGGTGGIIQPGNRPAPLPFPSQFRVVADPYPVHVGQAVTLESAGTWPGQWVWLYGVSADQQSTVFYDRKLPRNAILISRIPLTALSPAGLPVGTGGRWAFDWMVPPSLTHGEDTIDLTAAATGGDTFAYLVAVTDTGYLAATGLSVAPKRTLTIQPDPVKVGEALTISGADYPPGTKVRLDLYHDRSVEAGGGTDIALTIGWVTTDDGGRFSFRYAMPVRLNWAFADGQGQMVDHPLTVNGDGQFSIIAVEIHDDTGLRRALRKLFSVSSAP